MFNDEFNKLCQGLNIPPCSWINSLPLSVRVSLRSAEVSALESVIGYSEAHWIKVGKINYKISIDKVMSNGIDRLLWKFIKRKEFESITIPLETNVLAMQIEQRLICEDCSYVSLLSLGISYEQTSVLTNIPVSTLKRKMSHFLSIHGLNKKEDVLICLAKSGRADVLLKQLLKYIG